MLILISDPFGPELPARLTRFGSVTEERQQLSEANVVLVRSKTRCDRDYIDSAPKLELIIRGGVGMDNIDLAYAKSRGVRCLNTADASSVAVAELVFALMLGLPNHLVRADRSLREGRWLKKQLQRTELYGKTLGILGLGRIGLALAVRARAFRMEVLGWHPDVYFTEWAEICPTLEEVLRRSDFVSLHMPLVAATRGLIDRDRLALMKDGAYLINTARGGIIVEQDVANALESGKLGGYATDVWNSDPPGQTPLLEAKNTLLTPHIGASTKENMGRIGEIVERLIEEHAAARQGRAARG
jgi:D-3-phosphoglycerate dehydrogenase